MLNLEEIPEELREWTEAHLVPELEKLKEFLAAHATTAANVAGLVENLVQVIAPQYGDAVKELVSDAGTVTKDAEQGMTDVLAWLGKNKPSGM